MRQEETHVFDIQSAVEPLLFVIRPDVQDTGFFGVRMLSPRTVIQVTGGKLQGQTVPLHHILRISEKEIGIGFQVNPSTVLQETAVTRHKKSGGQTFGHLLHLRVAERQPNLGHFAFGKETVDNLYVRAQERHVGQAFAQRPRGPRPHTGTLDVHPDKILVGIQTSQPYGIFTPSAPEFQHNRMVVPEKIFMPTSFHIERHFIHDRIRVFKHMRVTGHVGKLC